MLSIFSSQQLNAGEIDTLVDKLVEKGFLTPVEAQIILDETKQEVAKEIAQGKSYALPKWVQAMKLKGDLRLRYQWNKKKSSQERHRGRYRFRLGVETEVIDNAKVGFGLDIQTISKFAINMAKIAQSLSRWIIWSLSPE